MLWYRPITPPLPNIKLRTVEKMTGGGGWVGGVVPLESIKMPCTLAPMLEEDFFDKVDTCTGEWENTEENCMKMFDKFYINCFAGHVDYEIFW